MRYLRVIFPLVVFLVAFVVAGTATVVAQDALPSVKRSLAGNMNLTYRRLPPSVDRLTEILSRGLFYGRLRSNYFYWDFVNEAAGERLDHRALGLTAIKLGLHKKERLV